MTNLDDSINLTISEASAEADIQAEERATELATRWHALARLIDQFKTEKDEVENQLIAAMPHKRLEVPGLGAWEQHRTADRKAWKHEEIKSEVIKKLRAGDVERQRHISDDGEITEEDDIELALRVAFELANPSWRVTALRGRDIDPDQHCEVKYGRKTLRFHGEIDGSRE